MTVSNADMIDSGSTAVRRRWLVVLGSFIANCVGAGPVMVLSMGIFLKPISNELGWQRGVLSAALFVATTVNAFSTPFLGRLIDRYGVPRVLLPSVALFAALTGCISLIDQSHALLFTLFALWGLSSAGHAQVPYVTVISANFKRGRGLALGLGMMGLGVGAMLIPPLVSHLIESGGWRNAYRELGLITLLIAFPAVALFVREPPGGRDRTSGGLPVSTGRKSPLPSIMRNSYRFWGLAIAVFLLSLGINGLLGHVSPILTDRGVKPGVAAMIAGVVGISTMVSRILSGAMVDRFKPPYVAALFFSMPLIGLLVLASGTTHQAGLVAGMVAIGLGFGAEADIVGVLVGRYFNLKHFGQIFGCMAFAFAIGVGIGPWLMSASYDATKSYSTALVILGVGFVVASLVASQLDRGERPVVDMQTGESVS
jgi:MFS family permease